MSRTWIDHFDAFGLRPCEEGKTPFQILDDVYRAFKEIIYKQDTDDQVKINAAIEADEWLITLELAHSLRDDCVERYKRSHDKRLLEVAELCEEEMKNAKARLYALKWLLTD